MSVPFIYFTNNVYRSEVGGQLTRVVMVTQFVQDDPWEQGSVGQLVVARFKDLPENLPEDLPKMVHQDYPEVLVTKIGWCKKTYKNASASGHSLDSGSQVNDVTLEVLKGGPDNTSFTTLMTSDKKYNFKVDWMVYGNLEGYLKSLLTVEVNREHSIGGPRPDTAQHLSLGSLLIALAVASPPGYRDIPHGCFTALEHSYHWQDTVA